MSNGLHEANFQCIIEHGEESLPSDDRREAIEWAFDEITSLRQQRSEASRTSTQNTAMLDLKLITEEGKRLVRLVASHGACRCNPMIPQDPCAFCDACADWKTWLSNNAHKLLAAAAEAVRAEESRCAGCLT